MYTKQSRETNIRECAIISLVDLIEPPASWHASADIQTPIRGWHQDRVTEWNTLPWFQQQFGCLKLLYVQATSKVISGWVPTCNNAHSWWLYSTVPLGNQTINTMTLYQTELHYPDTDTTSPCPILLLLNTWLEATCINSLSHWLDATRVQSHNLQHMTPVLYQFGHLASFSNKAFY